MILILTKGGAGSRAVAQIIQKHGVWFGQCSVPDMLSPDAEFQNLPITAALEATYGNDHSKFPAHNEKPGFFAKVCDALEAQEYDGGKFAVMTAGVYKNCFESFSPFKMALIDPLHENACPHLEAVPYQINVQDVLDRNFHVMKQVFMHCRIELDESLANDTLDDLV